MFVALDTTFTALAVGRAPVHPGDDLRGSADARRRRPRRCPDPAVPDAQRGALRRPAARDRGACAQRRHDRVGARGGRPGAAGLPAAQQPARAHGGGAATSERRRGRPRRDRPPRPDRGHPAARRSTSSRRRRPSATTRRSSSATAQRSLRQGNGIGHAGSGSSSSRPRRGRTTRAPRRRRPANGEAPTEPGDRNFLHFNPYPNTAAPGQTPIECEAGNEGYLTGAAGDRQRPARQPGQRHRHQGTAMARQGRAGDAHRGPQGQPGSGALILVVVLALGSYVAYTKELPVRREGYELHATFENAATLRANSPVRIAGVNVGEVTAVESSGDGGRGHASPSTRRASRSTRTPSSRSGRASSSRATSSSTSSPAAPAPPSCPTAATIPVTQTATAVQLDEVLTALQTDSREDLQQLLEGYGTALTYEPTAEDDKRPGSDRARRDAPRSR